MNAMEIQQGETRRSLQQESLASCAGDRLDGWKEIACYLRRSVRCVQRWEKNGGLPIQRHHHERGATVYAYRGQLDAWWRKGGSEQARENCGSLV
jgi:hypothetical protein